MKQSLDFLPADKAERIRHACQSILDVSREGRKKDRVSMVILFGSHARGDYVDDQTVGNGETYGYHSDFDLLVVLTEHLYRKTSALIGLKRAIHNRFGFNDINNLLRKEGRVRLILHDITEINEQLEAGQYFFSDIVNEGVLLYDDSHHTLAQQKPVNPADRSAKARADFAQWSDEGLGFCIAASEMIRHDRYNNAAFQLHQAAERFFNTAELVFTSYKSKTHNFIDLLLIAGNLHKGFYAPFPSITPRDEHMIELMFRAYVDARYRPQNYLVTSEDITEMQRRVLQLEEVTQRCCEEKLAAYEQVARDCEAPAE